MIMKLQLMYCQNVLWCMMKCGVSELAMKHWRKKQGGWGAGGL